MDRTKLIGAIKALNAVMIEDEDGKQAPLITPIKTVAVKQEVMEASFRAACESIPETQEDMVPDMVAEVYNEMVGQAEPAADEQDEATEQESEQTEAAPAEKPKKPKVDRPLKNAGIKKAGPSNKQIAYAAWAQKKDISPNDIAKLVPDIKLTTVRLWVYAWRRGNNLPAGA